MGLSSERKPFRRNRIQMVIEFVEEVPRKKDQQEINRLKSAKVLYQLDLFSFLQINIRTENEFFRRMTHFDPCLHFPLIEN